MGSHTGKMRTLTLLGINILVGLLIAVEIYSVPEPSAGQVSVPVQPQLELPPPSPPVFSLSPLENYAEIVKRPLFNSDRRPVEVTIEGVKQSDPLTLIGIVITPEREEALFLSRTKKETVRGLIDDWVEGWKIISIESDRVTIKRDNREEEIELKRSSPPLSARGITKEPSQVNKK